MIPPPVPSPCPTVSLGPRPVGLGPALGLGAPHRAGLALGRRGRLRRGGPGDLALEGSKWLSTYKRNSERWQMEWVTMRGTETSEKKQLT